MTINEAEQVARIIYNVFQHEEQIDPRTIALMFQHIGRVGDTMDKLYNEVAEIIMDKVDNDCC